VLVQSSPVTRLWWRIAVTAFSTPSWGQGSLRYSTLDSVTSMSDVPLEPLLVIHLSMITVLYLCWQQYCICVEFTCSMLVIVGSEHIYVKNTVKHVFFHASNFREFCTWDKITKKIKYPRFQVRIGQESDFGGIAVSPLLSIFIHCVSLCHV